MSNSSHGQSARSAAPTSLGPWRLGRLLGEGGWSVVYQATPQDCPEDWPADYAIKMLKPEYRADPRAVQLLQREAYAAKQFADPHLVTVLSSELEVAPFFLVFPYVEGLTAREALDGCGVFDIRQGIWIARQAAEALAEMHRQKWLHLDVKPSNLFVSLTGHATLIDLGLACCLKKAAVSSKQPLLGSAAYMAPEQFCTSRSLSDRGDIYSLGVTLFELLTGRPPYIDEDPADLALAHLQQTPPEARKLRPQLSLRMSRLLRRMLAKEPLRRPTAEETVALLTELEIESFSSWQVRFDAADSSISPLIGPLADKVGLNQSTPGECIEG